MSDLGTLHFGVRLDLEQLAKDAEKAQKEVLKKLAVKLKPTIDINIASEIKQQLKQPFDVKLQLDKSYLEKIRRQTEAVVNGVNPSGGRKFTASDLRATRANVLVAEHEQRLAALREVTRQKTANAKAAEERLNATRAKTALANERLKVTQEQLNRLMGETANKGVSLQGVFMRLGGAVALEELARKIVNVTGEFEFMEQAIKSLVGSEQEGVELMGKLREFARISPLEVKDVTKAAQTLLGFNVELKKVPDMIQRLGDVSMGNKERFNALTLAFAQTTSAARLTGEDLRQYVNAGFNPLQVMAEKTGKSMRELKDEMSKGAISVEMVEQAFIDATSAGGKFYQMSEKQAQTINGQLAKLSDTLDRTFDSIGRNNKGVITGAISSVSTLVENYEKVIHILEGLVVTYGLYRTAVFLATEAEKGYTIAQTLSMQATILLDKSQKALNATMLSNPYVLAAVALGGFITVILASIDSTNEAEIANERYNETLRKNSEEIDKEKKHIDNLLNTLSYETQAQDKRTSAYNELITKYPEIFSKYKTEKDLIDNLTEARRNENAEIERKTRLLSKQQFDDSTTRKKELNRLKWLQENIDTNTHGRKPTAEQAEYIRLYRKYEKEIKDAQTWYGSVESAISKLSGVADKEYNLNLGEQRKKQISDFTNAIKNLTPEQAKAQAKRYNNLIKQAQKQGKKWIGFGDDYVPISIDDAKNVAKQLEEQANKETHTLKEWAEQTAKNTDEARKAAKGIFDDTKQYTKEQAQKIIKSANATLEASEKESNSFKITDKEGDKQSKQLENERKKAETEAKQLAEAQEKITGIRTKAQLAAQQAVKDLTFSTREAEITLTEDATERAIKQIELDKDRKLEAISREYEALRQKRIEEAKKLWDADPNNKGSNFYLSDSYKFAASSERYTKAENANRAAREKAVVKEAERSLNEVLAAQKKVMYDYLREYGSIEQQRKAITDEYNEKIAKSTDAFVKARLAAERDKLLSDMQFKELQSSINWQDVFTNLGTHSVRYLTVIKKQLKQALDAKDITAENAKVIADKILEIENTIAGKTDILQALLPSLRERKRLTEEAAVAETEWLAAIEKQAQTIDTVIETKKQIKAELDKLDIRNQLGERIEIDLSEITEENKERLLSSLEQGGDVYNALLRLFRKLAADTAAEGEASDNVAIKKSYLDMQWDKIKGMKGSDLFSFAKGNPLEIISGVNDNAQSLAQMIDNFGIGETDFGKAVHNFADGCQSFTNIISDLASGNVVGAVSDLFSGVASWGQIFYAGGNEAEMEKKIERLANSNDKLAQAIESLSDRISNQDNTNAESEEAFKNALEAEKEWRANQQKAINNRASEWTNTGYGFLGMGGKSSFNANAPSASWEGWEEFNKILQRYGSNNRVYSAGSVWNLTPEEMKLLRDFAPKAWAELFNTDGHKNPEDLVKEYIEHSGAIDDLVEALNEKLTGYDWSGFRDSYKDLLSDLDSTNADFADNLEKMLSNAILNALINETYKERIKELYKMIADAASEDSEGGSTMTANELAAIRAANESLSNDLIQARKNLLDAGILKETSGGSSSLSGGIKAVTESTADLLSSYINGIRADVSFNRVSFGELLPTIEGIATHTLHLPVISSAVQKVSVLAQAQVDHLQQIADNTKRNADAADKIYSVMRGIETGNVKVTIK